MSVDRDAISGLSLSEDIGWSTIRDNTFNTTHVNLNQRVMALIMYFSIGNAYKISRFYATASSACKQLPVAINISVTLRHTYGTVWSI